MNLTVTGHHIDVTRSLKNYLAEKLGRLDRHSQSVNGAHVVLTVEKQRQKAEATIRIEGTRLHATTTRENMYAAIDLLVDKLDRQLIRYKQRSRTFHRDEKEKLLG